MSSARCFPIKLYLRKIINTFFPRILFRLSPKQFFARRHWREQKAGDIHGFENYLAFHPRIPLLIDELGRRTSKDKPVLDLGCNCGFYLAQLKQAGYSDLAGVDIAEAAIQYGRENLDLEGVELTPGSFEDVLPRLISERKRFEIVYSMGATIELIHPSFDIVGNLCAVCNRYVILIISEWGHSYPRFWEYEFNRHGFVLVRKTFPYDGVTFSDTFYDTDSFLVFERKCDKQNR